MTAEEFLNTQVPDHIAREGYSFGDIGRTTVQKAMIEFAKSHVKHALNTIYEEAKHGDDEHQKWLKEFFDNYPLDNIK